MSLYNITMMSVVLYTPDQNVTVTSPWVFFYAPFGDSGLFFLSPHFPYMHYDATVMLGWGQIEGDGPGRGKGGGGFVLTLPLNPLLFRFVLIFYKLYNSYNGRELHSSTHFF